MLKGGLCRWICLLRTGTGDVRRVLQAPQVVPAALGMDVVPAGLLFDPLGDLRTIPEPAVGRTTREYLSQPLLLLLIQQGRGRWRRLLAPPIAQGHGSFLVVAVQDPAGIAVAKANELGGLLDGLAIGDQT